MAQSHTEAAKELRREANQLELVAESLDELISEVKEGPVSETALSEHFHKIRTVKRHQHGYAVAIFIDDDGLISTSEPVHYERGTHYRHKGADAIVSFPGQAFMSSAEYARRVDELLSRTIMTLSESAANKRENARVQEQLAEERGEGA